VAQVETMLAIEFTLEVSWPFASTMRVMKVSCQEHAHVANGFATRIEAKATRIEAKVDVLGATVGSGFEVCLNQNDGAFTAHVLI
jgi:hypothetical protein